MGKTFELTLYKNLLSNQKFRTSKGRGTEIVFNLEHHHVILSKMVGIYSNFLGLYIIFKVTVSNSSDHWNKKKCVLTSSPNTTLLINSKNQDNFGYKQDSQNSLFFSIFEDTSSSARHSGRITNIHTYISRMVYVGLE